MPPTLKEKFVILSDYYFMSILELYLDCFFGIFEGMNVSYYFE